MEVGRVRTLPLLAVVSALAYFSSTTIALICLLIAFCDKVLQVRHFRHLFLQENNAFVYLLRPFSGNGSACPIMCRRPGSFEVSRVLLRKSGVVWMSNITRVRRTVALPVDDHGGEVRMPTRSGSDWCQFVVETKAVESRGSHVRGRRSIVSTRSTRWSVSRFFLVWWRRRSRTFSISCCRAFCGSLISTSEEPYAWDWRCGVWFGQFFLCVLVLAVFDLYILWHLFSMFIQRQKKRRKKKVFACCSRGTRALFMSRSQANTIENASHFSEHHSWKSVVIVQLISRRVLVVRKVFLMVERMGRRQ